MASEKQIAANRRNAIKSTGPRSAAAKKRVSRNAYRHGLSCNAFWGKELDPELEERACKLVGDSQDTELLQLGRAVAQAELELNRARRAKIAVIERIQAFGSLNPPYYTARSLIRWARAFDRGFDPPLSYAMAGHPRPMPPTEPERSAEAIRRALPELRKLDRYERRASARRDRAVRDVSDAMKRATVAGVELAEQTQFFGVHPGT